MVIYNSVITLNAFHMFDQTVCGAQVVGRAHIFSLFLFFFFFSSLFCSSAFLFLKGRNAVTTFLSLFCVLEDCASAHLPPTKVL